MSSVGIISDTHGVFDAAAAAVLKGVHILLHAGDVGHHAGHEEILKRYADATAAPVLAVAGNVDDGPGVSQLLPQHRVITHAGWRLLLVHIVASGPASKVDAKASALIQQHRPDIVVCGHSHKAAIWQAGGVLFINPGSAGPARFKLKRTVALLQLPPKLECNEAVGAGAAIATAQAPGPVADDHHDADGHSSHAQLPDQPSAEQQRSQQHRRRRHRPQTHLLNGRQQQQQPQWQPGRLQPALEGSEQLHMPGAPCPDPRHPALKRARGTPQGPVVKFVELAVKAPPRLRLH